MGARPADPTPGKPREVPGRGCVVIWSADGSTVEKRFDRRSWWFLDHRHDEFDRERRIGWLLRRQPPPIPTAPLLSVDRRRPLLRFKAIDGEPVGPKFPSELADDDLDGLIRLALRMGTYRPRARFLPRFDLARRLQRAVRGEIISPAAAYALGDQAQNDPPTMVFAHGDITARNVLRSTSGAHVLIDWEWAGLYPRGWEMAFLWFSLADLPDARRRVEDRVPPADTAWFWRSALLIQMLHLSLPGLSDGSAFRPKHEATRDELLARLL